jgi:hypothetical protein
MRAAMNIGVMLMVGAVLAFLLLAVNATEEESSHSANVTQAKALMHGMSVALEAYRTEYNQMPFITLPEEEDKHWQRSQGPLMQTLFGKDLKINPRAIRFYEPPPARDHRSGAYNNAKGEPVLADPWGEPFYVILDLEGDGRVPNPDPRTHAAQPFLNKSVILFSAGPDHDPNTWEDNVVSWK